MSPTPAKPYTVIAPVEDGVAYVALDVDMLVALTTDDSEPLVVLGLQPRPEGGYDLKLRRPNILELDTAMKRSQSIIEHPWSPTT